MDRDRAGRHLGFLASRLEDPRRIQLRQGKFLQAYWNRRDVDDITEVSHNLTKLYRVGDGDTADSVAVFMQPTMYSIQYTHDREFPLQARRHLPEPKIPDCAFSDLIWRRRSARDFDARPLSVAELSGLLFCALGETETLFTGFEEGDSPVEVSLRSIPSGGALHPTNIFAAVLQPGDLATGLYHYNPPAHELECVKSFPSSEIEALFASFPVRK